MSESNIIFGKRTVFEALENDVQIDKVYIDRDNQFMENIKRKVREKSIQISDDELRQYMDQFLLQAKEEIIGKDSI